MLNYALSNNIILTKFVFNKVAKEIVGVNHCASLWSNM
jgi:hypothetical protein